MIGALLGVLLGTIVMVPTTAGGQQYTTHCASCHGVYMNGSNDGPSLHGVGMAALDFWMRTGRMPAAVPWVQVGHRDERMGQGLPSNAIDAIETYLAPIVGGPPIPQVITNGNLQRGAAQYALNCAHCHGVKGDGGAIGGANWAPDLHHAAVTQIAEAVRIGPGEMPQFGEQQIAQGDLDAIARYVTSFRNDEPASAPFRSSGPIPEGAIGWVGIIALILFVFAYWRRDTPPAERRDTVRPDEPGPDARGSAD